MPDTNTPAPDAGVSKNDLRAKEPSVNLTPQDEADAIGALDALFAEKTKDKGPIGDPGPEGDRGKPGDAGGDADLDADAERVAAEKAAAEKAAADKAAADKAAADKANADKAAADKAAADKAAADKAAADKTKHPLDDVPFPPHTSVKATESFNKLKSLAKERQTALETQLNEQASKVADLTAQLEKARAENGTIPKDIQAELEDLRKFRLSKDIESDPTFKKFDTELKENEESVYKKLEAAGWEADKIARIKELGGIDNVDWEPLLPKIPLVTRRFLEATLLENEKIRDKRDAALTNAKNNAETFTKERAAREVSEIQNHVNETTRTIPWLNPQAAPANATPEQKSAAELAASIARDGRTRLNEYLADRSPARIVQMAIGTLFAHKLNADVKNLSAQLESATTSHKAAVEALTKERDALKAELTALKQAESPRLRGEGNITPPSRPVPKPGQVVFGDAGSALDALAKEAVARHA